MINDFEYYIQKYVSLCSLLCKAPADYTKENIKRHNRAMKQLHTLRLLLKENQYLANTVYDQLLNCEDIHVQQSAATDCLNLNVHTERAVSILESICSSKDVMASMGAKRTLLIWKGELNPDVPY